MCAVHGFWSRQHGLCLWAEDPGRAVKSPSQAVRKARPHPFAATAEELAEVHPGKAERTLVALPSLPTAPLDSPELVRFKPRRESSRSPMLLVWSVPILSLDPGAALAALDEPSEEVRYGVSVRYLAEVAAFARDLTDRGRVLPAMEDDAGPVSRWRPVLQGPDIVTFQELVAAMPPVCRAEVTAPTDLSGQSPTENLSAVLHALVDAAARERLAITGTSVLDGVPRRGRPPKRLPAVEAWLRALSTPDGRFDAEPAAVGELQQALQPWSEFGRGQSGPARATFRLTEAAEPGPTLLDDDAPDAPSADDANANAGWRLEFLLQSVEDPSLLVPAQQVWTGTDGLRRWIDSPDELMLAELGRASTVYPALAGALRQATPSAVELDADGAYDFLAHRAGLLDQAGFGVLVPSWWTKRRKLGLSGSATPQQEGGVTEGMFNREALCDFQWRLAIGDEPLTDEELTALAETKAPLVQLRGEWVAVDPEQVRRGLEFLERQADQPEMRSIADVVQLAASHPDDLDTPLPVTAVDADGWLGDLLSGAAEQTLQPVEPPGDLRATLRPYQQRGLSWLAFLAQLRLGACPADDMGLGKTIQLLARRQMR